MPGNTKWYCRYQDRYRAPLVPTLLHRLGDIFKQSCMVFTDQTGLPKLYGMVAYCLDTSTCRYRHCACIIW